MEFDLHISIFYTAYQLSYALFSSELHDLALFKENMQQALPWQVFMLACALPHANDLKIYSCAPVGPGRYRDAFSGFYHFRLWIYC